MKRRRSYVQCEMLTCGSERGPARQYAGSYKGCYYKPRVWRFVGHSLYENLLLGGKCCKVDVKSASWAWS